MRRVALTLLLTMFAVPSVRGETSYTATYSMDLVDEGGRLLPTFEHRGRTYVLGSVGQRYWVRVRSNSSRRAEVVIAVDGRDVIDGRPSSWDKRGYILEPYGELMVDGFRLNQSSVAAFRFSSVPRSYAAQTGDARDVGVIGVAVFPEREVRYSPPPPPYYSPYWYSWRERAHSSRGAPASEAEARKDSSAPAASGEGKAAPLTQENLNRSTQRPGLGTEFGEEHASYVSTTRFERESSSPETVLTLRYNDRGGLRSLGVDVDRYAGPWTNDTWQRETAEPFRGSGYAQPPPGWRPWQ